MTFSNDFEKIATKISEKNRLKTVGISVDAMLISALIIFLGLRSLERHAEMVKENYLLRSKIAYPNIDYTTWALKQIRNLQGPFIHTVLKILTVLVSLLKSIKEIIQYLVLCQLVKMKV